MRHSFHVALAILVAGCVPELAGEESIAVSAATSKCPLGNCGVNTCVIDGVFFAEGNEHQEPNAEGVALIGFQDLPPGATKLTVDKNVLVAVDDGGTVIAEGTLLEGSKLVFLVDKVERPVLIDTVRRIVPYIAHDTEPMETYLFTYPSLDGTTGREPLCSFAEVGEGASALDAIVFEGDRYDPDTRDITVGPTTKGWFNIACLSGAPSKNHRLRASAASSIPALIETDLDQRQAAFRMWSADYCGDGTAYTVPGEPLRIKDRDGWIEPTSPWSWSKDTPLDSYEAVWGPDGAVCLDTPRRADDVPDHRSFDAQIRDHCAKLGRELPRCSSGLTSRVEGLGLSTLSDWQSRGYYLTANPKI